MKKLYSSPVLFRGEGKSEMLVMFEKLRNRDAFDNFLDVIEDNDGLASSEQRKSLRKLRAARRAKQQAADDAYELFLEKKERGEVEGSFFQWLIENKDMILAMVTTLIKLFNL